MDYRINTCYNALFDKTGVTKYQTGLTNDQGWIQVGRILIKAYINNVTDCQIFYGSGSESVQYVRRKRL